MSLACTRRKTSIEEALEAGDELAASALENIMFEATEGDAATLRAITVVARDLFDLAQAVENRERLEHRKRADRAFAEGWPAPAPTDHVHWEWGLQLGEIARRAAECREKAGPDYKGSCKWRELRDKIGRTTSPRKGEGAPQ